MTHNPPCSDWRAHVQESVKDIFDSERFPRLLDFVNEVSVSWADEQLIADPEYATWIEARSAA